jgi:hypothetical protein
MDFSALSSLEASYDARARVLAPLGPMLEMW